MLPVCALHPAPAPAWSRKVQDTVVLPATHTGAWPPQELDPPPPSTKQVSAHPSIFTSLTAYHSTLFLPRPARAMQDAQQQVRIEPLDATTIACA